jgi:hypothetical protein
LTAEVLQARAYAHARQSGISRRDARLLVFGGEPEPELRRGGWRCGARHGGGGSCLRFNLTFAALVLLAALLALKRVWRFVTRIPLAAILCLGLAAAAPLGLAAR